ncbi:hypothetical protein L1277_002711 [Okibacterium sp. HSC-33S16]|uniref:DUF4238 domain-containing protein n=1 Tax=Okibacterium sp. HSC-33S16 TaxID=2910965 RepID=UPI00209D592D|nr:DUF4238 domain-containing protein [Okibacterium sp. HSC-33S16]MCP2032601.1 hypothetical protein [Okibacterium sp. HSC-33S16]
MTGERTHEAKRHHHVPQFYLRGFADGEQITTVRLPGDKRYVQSVRKAAAENGFYSVPGHEDGADVFEKMLSSIEGEAAGIFRSVESGVWPLEPKDRTTLGAFIALQVSRGPEQRRNMQFLRAQITRLEVGAGGRSKIKDWAKRKLRVELSDEQAEEMWEQATRPEGPPIRISPLAHIRQMAEQSEALTPFVLGRPWTLVRFDRRSLFTSDTPVGLVPHAEREDDHGLESGVGFMTAWGVTYPLTRKLGLLMSDPMVLSDSIHVSRVQRGEFDLAQVGSTQMGRFFNLSTVTNASEVVFHHPKDARFVPNELPEANPVTMRMAGLPPEFPDEGMLKPRPAKPEHAEPAADA